MFDMRIGKYLNTTKEEIENRNLNIFYGFSLGNKYFTPDRIRSYLQWAVENTRDKVLVLIPDKIHAANYEVKSKYSSDRAMSVALRKGIDLENVVREAIEGLKIPDAKIRILHWQDIEDASYVRMHNVINAAFTQNDNFREAIIRMIKETSHLNNLNLIDSQYERLAQYILDELPVLISGFTVEGIHYNLLPYPGFADLDYLALDLQEGTTFPEITNQLGIENKLKLIELYVD